MKRYLMAATMVAFVVAGWAAKAFPGKTIVKQGDGTKIVVQLHGDEYAHYYTAADGAILTMLELKWLMKTILVLYIVHLHLQKILKLHLERFIVEINLLR